MEKGMSCVTGPATTNLPGTVILSRTLDRRSACAARGDHMRTDQFSFKAGYHTENWGDYRQIGKMPERLVPRRGLNNPAANAQQSR